MELAQSLVVVTGAGSGLGLATARALATEGADVAAIDRTISAELQELGVPTYVADVADLDSVNRSFDQIALTGPIRGLVHCAGRGGDRARILDRSGAPTDANGYRDVIAVNLIGSYYVLQAASARMTANDPAAGERGAIVLTSSVAAFDGQIGQTADASAKAGVHAMTLVAARDLAAWQIRVNTIAPGVFDTHMLGRFEPSAREALRATVPFPSRLGHPSEFADLALALLHNDYINGETIRLDGALRMPPK
jgi:NAD(P)-dependent dehydrogenase (short-subunit alcohol dehydrogenase family)